MPLNKLSFEHPSSNTLRLKLSGEWQIYAGLPAVEEVISELSSHKDITQLTFDLSEIGAWDSALISFLLHLMRECGHRKIQVIREGLPEGINNLLTLALKEHERTIPSKIKPASFLERAADKFLQLKAGILALVNFLGEIACAFGRFFTGKAYFRRQDFFGIVQRCGADALGLVSLISLLVGIILAFIGAMQLQLFGAQIYIADIVGIGMVRVMGAVMTGIIMSGRTGASFAAELGLMQVNEEIDAYKTLGISPVEFLVMPRVLALMIMLPLLTLYADFMGIVGGFFISTSVLGLNPVEYWHHTQSAVRLSNLWVGLVHGFVFGIIIGVSGCLRGIKCGRSAEALGEATTSAVVTSITSIVVATAVITFICQVLGV
ncbi:MAG: ABC transporter permease [Candidatus Omnitrophica bacterium]|nr:ABC transporter permease [Candidatus Omnitrophota bacterium]